MEEDFEALDHIPDYNQDNDGFALPAGDNEDPASDDDFDVKRMRSDSTSSGWSSKFPKNVVNDRFLKTCLQTRRPLNIRSSRMFHHWQQAEFLKTKRI